MTVYECWSVPEELMQADDARSICFSTRKNALSMKAKGQMEPNAIPIYSIRADSWDEAMKAHHEVQKWEPYRPMD